MEQEEEIVVNKGVESGAESLYGDADPNDGNVDEGMPPVAEENSGAGKETAPDDETDSPAGILYRNLMFILKRTKPVIYDRCVQTGNLSMKIWDALGTEVSEELYMSAYIANIGYLGIPESIYYPHRLLSREEKSIIEFHTDISADIMASILVGGGVTDEDYITSICNIVRFHHELPMDNKGYKKKTDVPALVRKNRESFIIGIADRFTGVLSGISSMYRNTYNNSQAAEFAMYGHDETSSVFSKDDMKIIYSVLLNYSA